MGIDKKNVEGAVDSVKGHIKEGVGGLTGNRELEAEGQRDQIKGKIKDGLGNLRDGVKNTLEKAKDKLDSIDR